MSDRSVQDLINVAQKSVLVYFNLLSCLLNDYNFGVSLSEPANFSLDLEEAVLFTKFKSVAHVWLFDQCFERHSTIVLITAFLKSKVLVFVQGWLPQQSFVVIRFLIAVDQKLIAFSVHSGSSFSCGENLCLSVCSGRVILPFDFVSRVIVVLHCFRCFFFLVGVVRLLPLLFYLSEFTALILFELEDFGW